jgi:hypothetical protein
LVGKFAQADAAELELAENRPRTAATLAASVLARAIALRPCLLDYE